MSTGDPIPEGDQLIAECFAMLRGVMLRFNVRITIFLLIWLVPQDLIHDRGLMEFVHQYEAALHIAAVSIAYAERSPALSGTLAQHADAARQNLLKLSGSSPRVSESPNAKKAQRGAMSGRSISKARSGPGRESLLKFVPRRNSSLAQNRRSCRVVYTVR